MAERALEPSFLGRFVRYWLPVLLYITAIATLSAQPHLAPPQQLHLSDKFYHTTEYFGLGVLLSRAFRGGRRGPLPTLDLAMVVTLGVIVGASDEIFQSYIPGRQSDVFDLLADSTGILLAQIVTLVAARFATGE